MKKIVMLLVVSLMAQISIAEVFTEGYLRYMTQGSASVMCTGLSSSSDTRTSVVIPGYVVHNGTTYLVESVGNQAFKGNQYIQSVRIGHGVEAIAPRTFYDCPNLMYVYLPSSLNSLCDYCFASTTNKYMKEVCWAIETCPGDGYKYDSSTGEWTGISASAFDNSLGNTKLIASTVKGLNSFVGATYFSKYFYEVEKDGSKAYDFMNNSNGETYVVTKPKTGIVTSSTNDYTGEVAVVGLANGYTTLILNNYAQDNINYQYGNTTLRYTVKEVPDRAFYNHNTIVRVMCTNTSTLLDRIGTYAFASCPNLTTVTIGAKAIGNYAFYNSGLQALYMNNGVETLGNGATRLCNDLTIMEVPSTTTQLNQWYFWQHTKMTKYTVASGNSNYSSDSNGILYNADKLILYHCPPYASQTTLISNLPSTLIRVSANAFNSSKSPGVVIPYGTMVIADSAFFNSSMQYVKIPSTVRLEGCDQLREAKELKELIIATLNPPLQNPGRLLDVVPNTQLKIRVPTSALASYRKTSPWSDPRIVDHITDGAYDVLFAWGSSTSTLMVGTILDTSTSSAQVTKVTDEYRNRITSNIASGKITIPSIVTYKNKDYIVSSVEAEAFAGASNITGVTLPNTITLVGTSAFENAGSSGDVDMSKCEILLNIGSAAFMNCGFNSVTLPPKMVNLGNNVWTPAGSSALKVYVDNAQYGKYAKTANTWDGATSVNGSYSSRLRPYITTSPSGYGVVSFAGNAIIPSGMEFYYISGINNSAGKVTSVNADISNGGYLVRDNGYVYKTDLLNTMVKFDFKSATSSISNNKLHAATGVWYYDENRFSNENNPMANAYGYYVWDAGSKSFERIFGTSNGTLTVDAGTGYLEVPYSNQLPDYLTLDIMKVRGDLNGDGIVDVSDVNMMIDMVLGKAAIDISTADLNDDDKVDVSDVNAIIDIVLGK